MVGRIKLPFQARVIIAVVAIFWVMIIVFTLFQYGREKQFKADLLNARLQMHNSRIIEDMQAGNSIEDILSRISQPMEDLRITLIDADGNIVYDNQGKIIATNHNSRPEIVAARAKGYGYTIARVSEADENSYFYSAQLGDNGLVVRSAAPYSYTLSETLEADRTVWWIMIPMTLIIICLGFWASHRISVSIKRLNRFAEKAERGESVYSGESFPNDELGSIASNIVKLYVQREEQHRETIKLEQDKTRLKKQLTNNINHELKTPVTSILVSLDLLDDHPEMTEEKKQEIMGRIRQNARRLNSLLQDISTITRMDDGQSMIEMKPIDLTQLIDEIVEEARLRTDMKINVSVPRLTMLGDRNLVGSIFRNLIDNAINYSGGTEINVKADDAGNFRLWDNGVGVGQEHLSRIFERFYRVDEGRSRSAGGTGLGLSIVRNVVILHGGTIRAKSVKGLLFEFNLKVER